MLREFDCEGAPRDLGLDQGRACRDDLRARFTRLPIWERVRIQLGLNGERPDRIARDVKRYFPQQSEALEGMVRGGEVPHGWLVSVLDREFGADAEARVGAASAMAADAARAGGAPVVARTLACEPVVRYSRPDGGFASVELTLPWFTAALAGVNEGGLAATWVSLPGESEASGCTAPAAMLIQDCLARFDSIRGAADWCTGRPCGGRAMILLADAGGDVTALEVDGRARSVQASESGMVFAGDETNAAVRAEAKPALEAVAKTFGGRVAGIDPVGRRVALLDAATASCEWFEVRPQEAEAAAQP
jgi:hypothetical protein